MPTTTLTTSVYANPPMRLHHAAQNWVHGSYVASGRTLSDIILLAKIPNGVSVVDYYIKGTSGETASIFKLGIKGTGTETTFGTGTFSTGATVTYRPMTGIPFSVSLSDTDAQAGCDIYMTVSSGSWTTSVSFDFGFAYVAKGRA